MAVRQRSSTRGLRGSPGLPPVGAGRTITSRQQLQQLLGPSAQTMSLTQVLSSPLFTGRGAYTLAPHVYKELQTGLLGLESMRLGSVADLASKTPAGGALTGQLSPDQLLQLMNQQGASDAAAQQAREAQSRLEEIRLQAQLAAEAEREQRAWQQEQDRLAREAEERQRIEQLKFERQQIFAELIGKDPVRAVLFALGVGGQILPGGERFAELPPLQGAEAKLGETQTALQRLAGQYGFGGGPVSIGATGVGGIGGPEQAARAVMQGNEADRTLLSSAFGVGVGGAGGISPEELERRARDVTPVGVL